MVVRLGRCFTKTFQNVNTIIRMKMSSLPNLEPTVRSPYETVSTDIKDLHKNIQKSLETDNKLLNELALYHFDGQGKSFRPMVILNTALAYNYHSDVHDARIIKSQKEIAEIAEMIHVSSLVHDDVIDGADYRRGLLTVQSTWGQRRAILTGVYILSIASIKLARLQNVRIVEILSQVLEDLVKGEFMQIENIKESNDYFEPYITKTYKKTASLLANSCKAVALLSTDEDDLIEGAFEYGKNLGIAFQLIDDLMDFISSEELMGKPFAADLKLGLATAPVLFAAETHQELYPLIIRRFSQPGDIDFTWQCVNKSNGILKTRQLAEEYCHNAISSVSQLKDSPFKQNLILVSEIVLNRLK